MRSLITVIVVIALLVVGVYFLFGGSDQSGTSNQGGATTSSAQPASESSSEVTITYSSDGFSPSSVTVNSGGTITWANNSTEEVEIGANPHPIHTGNKEVSNGEFVLKLASGEKSSVTVTKTGTFGYHNHLDSSQGGSITVE